MLRRLFQSLAAAWLLAAAPAWADKITVAAAADLKFAMDEIVSAFRKAHPSDEVAVVYGSSGKFFVQLQNDAPFDIFFSADIGFPRALAKAGLAESGVTTYARGRVVLWSSTLDATRLDLTSLADPRIERIAMANPRHAPYGQRAEEALRAAGVWDKVERKLVLGENVAQTAQYVQTGNAQVGLIALSLAVSPELAGKGGYWLVPEHLHAPLEQGFVVMKRAAQSDLARRFGSHFGSEASRSILRKYGFVLPGETDSR